MWAEVISAHVERGKCMTFIAQNQRMLRVNEDDGSCADFCEEISVTKVKVNLLEKKHTVNITVFSKNGANEIKDLPRGEIASKGIIRKLANYGLTLPDGPEYIADVQYILYASEEEAPTEYYHEKLGFFEVDGKLAYLAHTPVGILHADKAKSVYKEPQRTKSSGTLESWLKTIDNEVVGNPNLELGLALGFTSPIAHLLKKSGTIANLPIWGLIGQSSTGKTLTLRLAASIYGNPNETKGILLDCNATENAFVAMLERYQGFPILIDEATNNHLRMESLLYSLAKGQAKRRCQSDGTLKEPNCFSGSVMISSERNLVISDAKTGGLDVRLQEFNLPWTNDAEHAHRLEKGLSKNYGTAIYILADWLLKNESKLTEAYDHECKKFRAMADVANGIEGRLLEKYAIILVAARVLKKALNINLNLPCMRDLLMSLHGKNISQISRAERVYDELVGLIVANNSRFFNKNGCNQGSLAGCNIWGEYSTRKGSPCVWINSIKFKDFLTACGESSSDRVLMAQLEQEGWLVRFSDRYCTNHRVGNLPISKHYCLMLTLGTIPDTPPKAKKKPKPSKNMEVLLSDEDDVSDKA